MTNLKDNILATIKTGSITMKPHWYFMLRGVFTLSGLVLVLLLALYFLSFVFFTLKSTGLLFMPGLGLGGLLFFVTASPWILIGVTAIFTGALYVLIRHYSFSYQKPALYTLLGTILVVIVTASLLHVLAFHDRVKSFSERHEIPGLSPLYRDGMPPRPPAITPGIVVAVEENLITITDETGTLIDVRISTKTRLPRNFVPEIGDKLMIFGLRTPSSTISAKGIRSWENMPERLHGIPQERLP